MREFEVANSRSENAPEPSGGPTEKPITRLTGAQIRRVAENFDRLISRRRGDETSKGRSAAA